MHTSIYTKDGMLVVPPKFTKASWQQFAKKAWGWDQAYAGRQYDLYRSGCRNGDLHDNTILLIDQNGRDRPSRSTPSPAPAVKPVRSGCECHGLALAECPAYRPPYHQIVRGLSRLRFKNPEIRQPVQA